MPRTKELTERVLERILYTWAEKLSGLPGWSKTDSETAMCLKMALNDINHEKYIDQRLNSIKNLHERPKPTRKKRGS